MNKSELVAYIAEKSEGVLTKKAAELAVDLFGDAIVETIKNGDKVTLVGLLTAEPAGRKARKGHNPQTGETLQIPAKMSIKLKPGKRLEEAVADLDVEQFIK